MEGGAPLLRAGSNGGDVGGDYAFAKYNKKIVRAPQQQRAFASALQP
jgi:hypothetical protein